MPVAITILSYIYILKLFITDDFSGISAGMYTTSSSEACLFICESSRANIVVVEDDKQLRKIIKIREKLPELKVIVQYHGVPRQKGVLSVSFTYL